MVVGEARARPAFPLARSGAAVRSHPAGGPRTNAAQLTRRPPRRSGRRSAPASAKARIAQRVPGGQHLVVDGRTHAHLTRLEQTGRRRPRPDLAVVSRRRRATGRSSRPSSRRGRRRRPPRPPRRPAHELVPRPDEELPLHAFAVGVLRREEPALGMPHLAQQVVERLGRDVAVAIVAGHEPRARVQLRELRVVVQHLLEVRHVPARVGAVPGEAAADLVVDAAGRHPVERERDHLERVGRRRAARCRSTNSSAIGCGNFGAPPNPPHVGSNESAAASRTPRRAIVVGERLRRRRPAAPRAPIDSITWPPGPRPRRAASRHASAIPSSTCRNDGIPWRGSSGKYVPA